jgi:hypothetical protein
MSLSEKKIAERRRQIQFEDQGENRIPIQTKMDKCIDKYLSFVKSNNGNAINSLEFWVRI